MIYQTAFLFCVLWSDWGDAKDAPRPPRSPARARIEAEARIERFNRQAVWRARQYRNPASWDVGPYYHRLAFMFSIAAGQWGATVATFQGRIDQRLQGWESSLRQAKRYGLPGSYDSSVEHKEVIGYVYQSRFIYLLELRRFVETCPNEPLSRFLRFGPRP